MKEKVERLPYGFEYIFVPNFMKGESLMDLPESQLAPFVVVVRKGALKCKYEFFRVSEDGKSSTTLDDPFSSQREDTEAWSKSSRAIF